MVMRLGNLDLNLLIALNVLIEERSVTRAAGHLNTSQPAMSTALAKLREFFDDELLVRSGGEMLLTAQAEFLRRPIAELLAAIQSTVNARSIFDPSTAERRIRVMMSDYMATIIMPELTRYLRVHAPLLGVDVIASEQAMVARLERGEIDLGIAPDKFMSPDHPSTLLCEDPYVVIVDRDNPNIGDSISREEYLAADHVVVKLTDNRGVMFEDWFLEHVNVRRRAVVTVPLFTMVPSLVVGTTMIATLHDMLARELQNSFPIRTVASPETSFKVREYMQWHRMRNHDLGLAWFRDRIADAVAATQARLGTQQRSKP